MRTNLSPNLFFRICALTIAVLCATSRADAAYKLRWTYEAAAGVTSVAFSPQGDLLAAGTYAYEPSPSSNPKPGHVHLWSAKTGVLLHTFLTGSDVFAVAWTPDGNFLLGLGGKHHSIGELNVWNVKAKQRLTHFENPQGEAFCGLAISPDGRTAACGTDGSVYLVNISNGKVERQIMGQRDEAIYSLSFSPHGKYLLGVSTSGSIRNWEVATGVLSQPETKSGGFGFRAIYLRDGRICFERDGNLSITNQTLSIVSRTIKPPLVPIEVFAIDKFGVLAATGSGDTPYRHADGSNIGADPVQIWNLQTGKLDQKLEGHMAPVGAVAFSPDSWLASSGGSTVRVWQQSAKP